MNPCATCLHNGSPIVSGLPCGDCEIEESGRHTQWHHKWAANVCQLDRYDITNAVAAPPVARPSRQARPGFLLALGAVCAAECVALGWLLVKAWGGRNPWN